MNTTTKSPSIPESDLGISVLSFNVFRSDLGDCTNGGATSKARTIYVTGHKGFQTIGDVVRLHGEEAARLVFDPEDRGALVGQPGSYWAAKHRYEVGEGHQMSGGNLASTCDSRALSRIYHVHDRFEKSV